MDYNIFRDDITRFPSEEERKKIYRTYFLENGETVILRTFSLSSPVFLSTRRTINCKDKRDLGSNV